MTIVDSLAEFYRLSLSKGNGVVTLRDEFNHVRSYFQIQNLKIKLNTLVPEDLGGLYYSQAHTAAHS